MEDKEKKEIYEKYIIILFIFIILMCPITIFIVFMTNKNMAVVYSEASFLATGIAVIGASIAVWTGLNIANSVNRKELEEIDKKTKESIEEIDSLREKTNTINNSVEKSLNSYNKLFLQELLKTSKDIMSMYFYDEFSDYFVKHPNHNLDALLLMEIEHDFVEVYNLSYCGIDQKESLISKAEDGLNKINGYLANNPKDLVRQYLDYRTAEFKYYRGYNEQNLEDVYKCFKDAINICLVFAQQINIPLEYDGQNPPDYNGDGELVEMACYLSGAVGDSYSRIVFEYSKKEPIGTDIGEITKERMMRFAKKAVYFCGCAAKWSKGNSCEREVYFRNLGCAYERLDKLLNQSFENKDAIMDNYKYAFQKMYNDSELMEIRKQKIYHTILSYFEKYFNDIFSKLDGECLKYPSEKRTSILSNETELSGYRKEVVKMIGKIKTSDHNTLDVERLRDYVTIASSGVVHNPHYTLRISLLGLAYTYVVFLIKADDDTAKKIFPMSLEYYIGEIEKLISYLNIIGMKDDDYANELRLRFKGIMVI